MIGLKRTSDRSVEKKLKKLLGKNIFASLDRYGQRGVEALAAATPVETGLTADSWEYEIVKSPRPGIRWYNTNVVNGTPVVIMIQYGHGTGTGGYVYGRDFINPAMRPVFDTIAQDIWKEVTR